MTLHPIKIQTNIISNHNYNSAIDEDERILDKYKDKYVKAKRYSDERRFITITAYQELQLRGSKLEFKQVCKKFNNYTESYKRQISNSSSGGQSRNKSRSQSPPHPASQPLIHSISPSNQISPSQPPTNSISQSPPDNQTDSFEQFWSLSDDDSTEISSANDNSEDTPSPNQNSKSIHSSENFDLPVIEEKNDESFYNYSNKI